MKASLPGLLLFFLSSVPAFSETKVFENYNCSIELPDDVTWQTLPPEQVSNKENFFASFSPNTGNLASITFQAQPIIQGDQAVEDYMAGAAQGMKENGFKLLKKNKQNHGTFPGYLVTSKGPMNGYDCTQTSWYIFTPRGTYIINSGIMEFSEKAGLVSGKILPSFKFLK